MTRAQWWLVDKLSLALEPDEREAVCGDLAESEDITPRALVDLLGLVVRRQAALWMDWWPWLTLAALVLPLGVLLSLASERAASGSAIPIWMYLDNWTPTVLESPGSRSLLLSYAISILNRYLIVACWSWAVGLVLGALTRRTAPLQVVLLSLVVVFAGLVPSPDWRAGGFGPNAAVFSLAFYRVAFPLILQAVLVLLPVVWGMRQGRRLTAFPPLLRSSLLVFALATVVVLAARSWGLVLCSWGSMQACMEWNVREGYAVLAGVPTIRQIPLLPMALIGPVAYAIATGIWRRWRGRTVMA